METPKIALVVHGGSWEIPDALVDAHRRGCDVALAVGLDRLRGGASALDAVEAAVRSLESDPTFDAGYGTFLNRDGVVELDAGLMDGESLASGAVASVTGVPHPVTLARRVLERGVDRLVVGPGAEALAVEYGVETVDPDALVTEEKRAWWRAHRDRPSTAIFEPQPCGTVGAVALDASGRIAAATSTGGLPGKRRGRVGDSPLVGSGFYADSATGGASASGHGEAIMTVGLSRLVVERLAHESTPAAAAATAIAALASPRVRGVGGVIVLDVTGRFGVAFNTSRMARAWCGGDGTLGTAVDP